MHLLLSLKREDVHYCDIIQYSFQWNLFREFITYDAFQPYLLVSSRISERKDMMLIL